MRTLELEQAKAKTQQAEADTMKARAQAEEAHSKAIKAEIEAKVAPEAAKLDLAGRAASVKSQSQQGRSAGPRPADGSPKKGGRKGN
jgi:hypothetical protein